MNIYRRENSMLFDTVAFDRAWDELAKSPLSWVSYILYFIHLHTLLAYTWYVCVLTQYWLTTEVIQFANRYEISAPNVTACWAAFRIRISVSPKPYYSNIFSLLLPFHICQGPMERKRLWYHWTLEVIKSIGRYFQHSLSMQPTDSN